MDSNQPTKLAKLELFSKNNIFVYLTSLYIIVWYLQLGTRVSILGTIRFEFLLGAFLGLTALFKQLQSRSATAPLTKYVYLFFFIVIIQIPFSAVVEHSFDVFIDRVFKFSLLALFISTFIKTPAALKIFIFAFLLACLKLSLEGFIGWNSGSLVWQNQGIMRLHGSTPILKHPNSFSGFGVGLLPFIYYLFPAVNRYYKVALLALLVLAIVIIIFTGSRTGYVATIGFLGYAIYKSKYRLKVLTSFLLLLIASYSFIPTQYIERFESIYTLEEKEGNSSGTRLKILEDSVEIFLKHPFGVGVAAFPAVRETYFGLKQDTHNLYFEVLTNLGVQGLVVFILLISQLFKTINKNERELNRIKSLFVCLVNTTSFAAEIKNLEFCISVGRAVRAFIIIRLLLGVFGMDLYEIYWWLAIGLTLSISSICSKYLTTINDYKLNAV
ncbi:O-antigen ligase family protein [Alkalimarinus sediminis]|uniref:O-antigen ligase family protein n=1 Tax=Alkalimarinus sediminis TaxID=1632866 RepID=A0A9E8KQR6_9ALTE|nr:O-antigen ligase family protein [Alkalimarinus sediminis]UZW76159.1 O-antigen ligase family protein [Alkalimarinus sediminis]